MAATVRVRCRRASPARTRTPPSPSKAPSTTISLLSYTFVALLLALLHLPLFASVSSFSLGPHGGLSCCYSYVGRRCCRGKGALSSWPTTTTLLVPACRRQRQRQPQPQPQSQQPQAQPPWPCRAYRRQCCRSSPSSSPAATASSELSSSSARVLAIGGRYRGRLRLQHRQGTAQSLLLLSLTPTAAAASALDDDRRGDGCRGGGGGGGAIIIIIDAHGNATNATATTTTTTALQVTSSVQAIPSPATATRPRLDDSNERKATTTTLNNEEEEEGSILPSIQSSESSSSAPSSPSPSPSSLALGGGTGTKPRTRTTTIPTASLVLLNAVAVLWGTQHAVIKSVVDPASAAAAYASVGGGGIAADASADWVDVDPAAFTLARFLLAAAAATGGSAAAAAATGATSSSGTTKEEGLLPGSQGAPSSPQSSSTAALPFVATTTLRWGLELGLYMFLGFAFQAIGLQHTTASKSGFLLYLNVKFVPLLAYLLLGRTLTFSTVLSALAAFAGTALLATNGQLFGGAAGSGDSSGAWNVGDAWSVMAALASAMFILRLERASVQAPSAADLNAAALWTVALLSFLWWMSDHLGSSLSLLQDEAARDATSLLHAHLPELLYLSVVATALTNWIQTVAQRDVPAERASVIYAMDPVYGAAFAHLWLGENLDGVAAWVGAAIIVVAAATNAMLDLPVPAQSPAESGGDEGSAR